MTILADNIRAIRLAKGMTLEAFGTIEGLDVKKNTVQRWETDQFKPSADKLRVIAELGNVTIDDLETVEWKENTQSNDILKKCNELEALLNNLQNNNKINTDIATLIQNELNSIKAILKQ